MSGSHINLLPHFKEMVPQKALMYSIALEGWRRGLILKFYTAINDGNFEIQFSLEGKNRKQRFDKGSINKVKTSQEIDLDVFPENDQSIDIPKAIIDYYFPETINNIKSTLYIDFNKIHSILRRGLLEEIVVSNVSDFDMIEKKFLVYGDVQTRRFHNWLQKNTLNLKLNGYAKSLKNGTTFIMIKGEQLNVEKFSNLLTKSVPQMERNYNNQFDIPLKVGFEIID